MTLSIDTDAKTITVAAKDIKGAKYFAEQHDLLWMDIIIEHNPTTDLVILPNPESDAPKIEWDKGIKYEVKMTGGFIDYPEGHEDESILKFK